MADIRKRLGPKVRGSDGKHQIDRKTGETKRETRYQARIRLHGYSLSRTFKLRGEAQAWATRVEAEIRQGTYRPEAPTHIPTLSVALERYVREITSQKASPQPEGYRARRLAKSKLGKKRLDQLSSLEIARYRDHRRDDGRSAHDIRLDFALLSHLFSIARREWGMIDLANPVELVTKPKLPAGRERRLKPDELERLLHEAESYGGDIGSMIRFALATGMRRGEIAGMHWQNLDRYNRVYHIPITKDATTVRGRDVPLSSEALRVLNALRHRTTDRIWGFEREDSVSQAFGRVRDKARAHYVSECQCIDVDPDPRYLTDLRFHDLRHEATSRFFEMGLDSMEVISITGHKDPKMMRRYTHLRAEELAKKLS